MRTVQSHRTGQSGSTGQGAEGLVEGFKELKNSTKWTLADQVKVGFVTHHPQGMVKVGDLYFLSSVEIIERPRLFDFPQGGYDRTPGKGVGHLFKLDQAGGLVESVTLGEGDIYHPGGIDYDGEWLWVPVAEYRPNSASIIYRVDPSTLEATEVLRFQDHIGGVVRDTESNSLHGVGWGSRRFYHWKLNDRLEPANPGLDPEMIRALNTSHFIDYQDCQYAGDRHMLCSGVNKPSITGAGSAALGGLELIDLATNQAVHQVPVPLWVKPELAMTNNPAFCESESTKLRCYFMPEDDASTLYVYDAMK